MTPLSEEQLEKKRHDRKIQILAAAIKVFAENGIKLTKISVIAKEAGISHGLLYHYFQSKEEVLHASLEWATAGTNELFDEITRHDFSALEKIRHFTKIALSEGNSDTFRVIQHVMRAKDLVLEVTNDLIEKQGSVYIKQLLPLFSQAQADGEIIEDDPQELLALFLTVITGILMEGDQEYWSHNLDHKVNLILRMFTAR
ncbi:TetR/AcrR family transcriptional regulator [Alkalihalobacillus oceani]|uniref:TetR/AcrR family transcriptional regulator n=1 Tax=Halalkalibacter oceani TaxID=1653776 RepID=UPI002041C87C|nr:TetR/AcrR family transcriptional regulator [Halalkalibacter oceani]MCM3759842.1 TetR/AcrR family transcriptional regulator [Halalkalibacter oceani]